MSEQKKRLAVLILRETFGDAVAAVAEQMCRWGVCSLADLLTVPLVHDCLAVLVQHNVVTCVKEGAARPTYDLQLDRAIEILRYPRYLSLVKKSLGDLAELLVDEALESGCTTRVRLLEQSAKRLPSDGNKPGELLKRAFASLAEAKFLVASEEGENGPFRVSISNTGRVYRDAFIVQAVSRRIDAAAGTVMEIILNLAASADQEALAIGAPPKESDSVSRNIHLYKIKEAVDRCDNTLLKQFRDQYLRVLEEDRTRFVSRVGDEGGGVFVVNFKHIYQQLAIATVENVVLERFGSKALRIFRVVREKNYVEESQLQNVVMIPAKETKFLTYQLLEGGFIQLQELRKSLSANAPSKSFYLFYVDVPQVARLAAEMCYKSLGNMLTRKQSESQVNQRLLEKQERIETVAASIRLSERSLDAEELKQQLEEVQEMMSPHEQQQVKFTRECLDVLAKSSHQIDETLFVLEVFLNFSSK